jgi:Putative prokaryotic signal transducing protein
MHSDTSIPPDPHIELVPVFRSGDQGRIVLAKSLLESEGIDYLVRGEGVQDLFGLGRLAIGFSNVVGPAEFLVRKADHDRARELLRDLSA